MDLERDAKEISILKLFDNFRTPNVTDGVVDAYLDAVADFSADAVRQAVARLCNAEVKRDHAFTPSGAELAVQARLCQSAIDTTNRLFDRLEPEVIAVPIGRPLPDGFVTIGPTKVDFGHGTIDMSEMTPAEKEAVFESKGLPKAKATPQVKLKRMDE